MWSLDTIDKLSRGCEGRPVNQWPFNEILTAIFKNKTEINMLLIRGNLDPPHNTK
ncbi:hypothetical protein HF072_08965 [Bacillus sp. RO3]|nr:hypothetical protein [Bacillus sp. RO3]